MTPLDFVKSHGLGNDFVLVERPMTADQARDICRPRRGVGADGIISIDLDPQSESEADATIVIRNADGSRPEMCGNGLRCTVRYLDEAGYWDGRGGITVETDAGLRRGRIAGRKPHAWLVEVSMGKGEVTGEIQVTLPWSAEEGSQTLHCVDVGNPHAVAFDCDWDVDEITALGEALNHGHEAFPDGVNLEVVRQTQTDRLVTVVYERGVGLTDACGTGACAVALASWERSGQAEAPDDATDVELPGGVLAIERREDEIWLTGPVVKVFEGEMLLEAVTDGATEGRS